MPRVNPFTLPGASKAFLTRRNQVYIQPQDIDKEIDLAMLANTGKKIVKQKMNTRRMTKRNYNKIEPKVDEVIAALRNSFIESEKGKVYHSSHLEAEAKAPKNSYGKIMREWYRRIPIERDRLVQEHIDRKMPKIEEVLAKLREGMIMGFAPPALNAAPKEENLLRFNNLSSINFSAPAGSAAADSGAPRQVDPFEGLGGKRKTRRSRKSKKTRKVKRT
jgi:hypothetical protein